jgi:acyl-coenzyme A synthetase/AMP-(fatty) acid ligase
LRIELSHVIHLSTQEFRAHGDHPQDIVNLVTESVKEDAKKLRGGVIFADHLPKNPQGKLLRRKLLELYEENIITA